MTDRQRKAVEGIDARLLRQQVRSLAEIQAFLVSGEPSPRAEDWPEHIEGVLSLLGELITESKS